MAVTSLLGRNDSRAANIILLAAPTVAAPPPGSAGHVQPLYAVAAAFGVGPPSTPGAGAVYGTQAVTYNSTFGATDTFYGVGADWTDLTPYVTAISIHRGRQHELDRTEAGTAQITLQNRDRRFDPSNASGPYFGNLVPMTLIRAQAIIGAATYDLFHGFVQDWGQEWSPRPIQSAGPAQCQVRAVDGFGVLAMFSVADSLYSQQVLSDSPALYLRLADPAGTAVALNEGSVTAANLVSTIGLAFGYTATEPLTGGQSVAALTSGWLRDLAPDASLKTLGAITCEAWVYCPSGTFGGDVVTANDCWRLRVNAGLNASRRVEFAQYPTTGGPSFFSQTEDVAIGATAIPADSWHHIAGVRDPVTRTLRVYLDGKLDGTKHYTQGRLDHATYTSISIGKDSTSAGLVNGSQFIGDLAQVAVYPVVLPDARIATHAATTADSFGLQSAGAAVSEALDGALWPTSMRSLDVGSQVAAHDPAASVLEEVLAVAEDTDRGLFFVAGNGTATYVSRNTLHGLGYIAPLYTFGDSTTEIAYSDLTLTNDDTDLHNLVTVGRQNGTVQVAADSVSQARYGVRSLDISGTFQVSDSVAADLAQGLLVRYKDPKTRPQRMEMLGGFSDPPLSQMASLELGSRVLVRRRPPGGGAPIDVNATIEGISHEIAGGKSWLTTWDLTPAEATFWILDDPTYGVLDSTTRLSY